MNAFETHFANVKRAYDANAAATPSRDSAIVCKQGTYGGSAVLKLQKPTWTNDGMDRVPNASGIFFSVWLDENDAKRGRLRYNIHALKLRHLAGYRLTSRAFATAFRAAFEPTRDAWPNVRTDFGPLTLMEGWIAIDSDHFERDVLALLHRFESLVPILDGLLARHSAPPSRGPLA